MRPNPASSPRTSSKSPLDARSVLVLAPIMLLSMVAALELTMVYPAIRHMIPVFRTADVAWALTIVSLVGVATEPLTGRLADMYGKKRVLLGLVVLFAVGSVMCALTSDLTVLLIGRALQGAFLAVTGIAYGLVRDVLPAEKVPLGLGVLSTGLGLSAVIGPFAGGALIDHLGYRSVFWFGLIYVAVVTPLFWWAVPESTVRLRQRLDILGALLVGGGIGLILLVVSQGTVWGWTAGRSWACYVAGAVLLAVFAVRALRIDYALFDVRLMFGRSLAPTMLVTFLGTFVLSAYAYLSALMLQTPREDGISYGFGLSAFGVATYQLPYALIAVLGGLGAGMLVRRRGPVATLRLAMASFAVSMALFAFFPSHSWQILVWTGLYGVGYLLSPLSTGQIVLDAAPADQTAVSASVLGVARSLGSGIAIPVSGTILAQHVLRTDPQTHQPVYADAGFMWAFLAAAACGLVAFAVAAMKRTPPHDGRRHAAGRSELRPPVQAPVK
ncbi:MFS transporter [Yinghuangia sp. YIM S09857]|uniref:MFS transporter n=1 Tax=Yinghuangia sp. YIM S09857 TaxID=3436929 RepID=UPI003F53D4AB